jgi:gliding motility-associated-like protein
MTLNGGTGDIVASEKNIVLYPSGFEKLEVIPASDGISFWLIAISNNNEFASFRIDNSGIQAAPVISTFVQCASSGHMKINRQFNKLAIGGQDANLLMYDFNNVTGVVSNPITLNCNFLNSPIYGVEFSSDSKVLYISDIFSLYQLDLTQATPLAIQNSAYEVAADPLSLYWSIQLGVDDKIYINGTGTLSAINIPNNLGAACNFQTNIIANQTAGGFFGLPKYIYETNEVTVANTIELSSAAGTDNQTICASSSITAITFTTTGATGATFSGLPTGVSGSFSSNTVTIIGAPSTAGTFPYNITLTGGHGIISYSGTITVTPANTIALSSAFGTNNQTICILTSITTITYATTGAQGAAFTGLPVGVTGSFTSNTVTINGTPTATGTYPYTVTLIGGCGSITSSGTITANPTIVVEPAESNIFPGQSVQLNTTGGNTYTWLNTAGLSCSTCANPIATPTSTTTYCVEGTSLQGCIDTVCVAINVKLDCGELYIPTGFSPNNDGKNDVFKINVKNECITEFNLKIYDRLGELIFESNTINSSWDGTYKGNLLNDGVFVYQLSISFSNSSKPLLKKGNITLIK